MKGILLLFILLTLSVLSCDEETTEPIKVVNSKKTCDFDGDGEISKAEDAECLDILRECDKDENKDVTEDELVHCAFDSMIPGVGTGSSADAEKGESKEKKCDADGDGKLSVQERKSCLKKEVDCEAILKNKQASPRIKAVCQSGVLTNNDDTTGTSGTTTGNTTNASTNGEGSYFGVYGAFNHGEYTDFGKFMGWKRTEHQSKFWSWAETNMKDLGAHFTRGNTSLIWETIDQTGNGSYTWNSQEFPTDDMLKAIYKTGNNLHWVGVINFSQVKNVEGHDRYEPPKNPNRKPSRDPLSAANKEAYKSFVKAMVDRFNGDGKGDDLSSKVKVKYWQVGNEIEPQETEDADRYVELLLLTKDVIRKADPDAKIILTSEIDFAGELSETKVSNAHLRILEGLKGHDDAFDIVDIHWWSGVDDWKMEQLDNYKSELARLGFTGKEIWSCENATWEGKPKDKTRQTEEEQAQFLIKRYVYNLNNGVSKIFWTSLVDWYNYVGEPTNPFNFMGLISDGQTYNQNLKASLDPGTKRLAYYAYKLLAGLIDAPDAEPLGKISDLSPSSAYGYGYKRKDTGKEFYILWAESDTEVTFKAASHVNKSQNMIAQSGGIYSKAQAVSLKNGKVTVKVGKDPILISDVDIQ